MWLAGGDQEQGRPAVVLGQIGPAGEGVLVRHGLVQRGEFEPGGQDRAHDRGHRTVVLEHLAAVPLLLPGPLVAVAG